MKALIQPYKAIPIKCKFIVVLILWLFSTSLIAQQQDESSVIYEASYFAQYNAVTLTDMIRYIPGGEMILNRRFGPGGGGYFRGFGSNDSQVLLNGRRMSGKINNMSTALARIQASQVERIELIRGNAEGLDIRNEGIIYNVILEEGAENSSSSFVDAGVNDINGMDPEPAILASYNASRGPLEFGLSYQYENRPRLNLVDEHVLNSDRTLREFRDLFNAQTRRNHIVTGNFAYTFQNGVLLQLNGLISDNAQRYDRHEDQFLIGTGGTLVPNAIEVGDIENLNDENKLDKILKEIKLKITDLWKSENIINLAAPLTIRIKLEYENIEELSKLKNIFQKMNIIEKYSLEEFNINESYFKIYYYGSPKRLKIELSELGYHLKNNQGYWGIYKND